MQTRTRTRLSWVPAVLASALVPLLVVTVAQAVPALVPARDVRPATPLLRLAPVSDGLGSLDLALGPRLAGAGDGHWRTRRLTATAFDLVGVTWRHVPGQADPQVRVRWRTPQGWRHWRRLPPQVDLPGPGEGRRGVRGTEAVWTGSADAVQVDVQGARPPGLTLALMDASVTATDRQVAAEGSSTATSGTAPRTSTRTAPSTPLARATRAPRPALLFRGDWGADPSWRNGTPTYNRTIKQVHIHHTATSVGYAPEDVPGIIRGIYRYHTHSLGWFDIGYNFLVDRFGRTWVGRSGGFRRPVQGAHTRGFNRASVGVAVIGNYQTVEPPAPVTRAIVRLAAWKLDAYGRDPLGWVWRRSEGSDRYPSGAVVHLPVIDGHRDTNETSCPGQLLYNRLDPIRRRTARRAAYFS